MAGHRVAPVDRVLGAIHVIRGQRVMLDADRAALYGVSTKRLNEQVRRNRLRFPEDFMFEVTVQEPLPPSCTSGRSRCCTSNSASMLERRALARRYRRRLTSSWIPRAWCSPTCSCRGS